MPTPDQLLAVLALKQCGLFTRDDARAVGLDPRVLDRRVDNDLLAEPHQKVYRAATTPLALAGRERAALLAVGPDAMLSHDSAARHWELGTPLSTAVWITRPWTKHLLELDGVEIVRSRRTAGVRRTRNGVPVTSAARTFVDLGRTRTPDQLESALATGYQKRLWTPEGIRTALDSSHNKAGTGLVRKVLPRFEPEWESALSARFARCTAAAGIQLKAGHELRDDAGVLVAVLDFADVVRKIAFEVDGWYYHGSKAQQQRDKERDRMVLRRFGFITVRFTTVDVMERTLAMLTEIGEILQSRLVA